MTTQFIDQLDTEVQEAIRSELEKCRLSSEEMEIAMSGRLCDLEDTIDIEEYKAANKSKI